jgi:pimeloyl-ACP methyl ester carboxylesterase
MIRKILKWLLIAMIIAVGALFAWGYAPDLTVAELKPDYANAESEFVDLGDGFIVHLRDEGPLNGNKIAPAIILLHGSNASLHTWDEWTNALKGNYRIIRYDQAGHGLTGPHPKNCYMLDCYTDVVVRVAANRGLTKFTLGGNSMGGGISYAFAHSKPEMLDGLILVDPSGAPETKKADLPIGFKIAQTPALRGLMSIITPRSIIATSLKQTVSDPKLVTDAKVDLYWKMLRRTGNREATALRFVEYAKRKQAKPVQRPDLPTLIQWGDQDKLINVDAVPWFEAQFPKHVTKIYKGIGHLPMEEIPVQSASDVSEWMAELKPTSEQP